MFCTIILCTYGLVPWIRFVIQKAEHFHFEFGCHGNFALTRCTCTSNLTHTTFYLVKINRHCADAIASIPWYPFLYYECRKPHIYLGPRRCQQYIRFQLSYEKLTECCSSTYKSPGKLRLCLKLIATCRLLNKRLPLRMEARIVGRLVPPPYKFWSLPLACCFLSNHTICTYENFKIVSYLYVCCASAPISFFLLCNDFGLPETEII